MSIKLQKVMRTTPDLLRNMSRHYSQPNGFVGRNICYRVWYDDVMYGHIVGGSATRHLPGRKEFFGEFKLNTVINNIFYHVEPHKGEYPLRNFTSRVLLEFERVVAEDWISKYSDVVIGFESLVELPRTGDLYKRAGYSEVGITKGFTCKRVSGYGTDSWSGHRVWDTENLRPKRVFCKRVG